MNGYWRRVVFSGEPVAMGADLASSDNEAISHMAGIIDGITLATTKIRAHGLDNWTKG